MNNPVKCWGIASVVLAMLVVGMGAYIYSSLHPVINRDELAEYTQEYGISRVDIDSSYDYMDEVYTYLCYGEFDTHMVVNKVSEYPCVSVELQSESGGYGTVYLYHDLELNYIYLLDVLPDGSIEFNSDHRIDTFKVSSVFNSDEIDTILTFCANYINEVLK